MRNKVEHKVSLLIKNHHNNALTEKSYIKYFSVFLLSIFFLSSCAQVPQSSVTLSNSIGNDVASMQLSHKNFVNFYYDSLEQRANNLIDNTYRPYLLRSVIAQDVETFKNPAKKDDSLFNAIQIAFIDNDDLKQEERDTAQANAMEGMKILYTSIDRRVEARRKELLNPLKQQRTDLLGRIDANYVNIIKKNAAITALLSSVIDVHETQQQLFEIAGVDIDVRSTVSGAMVSLANTIDEVQEKVDEGGDKVGEINDAIDNFKNAINSN